ncbi:MAG: hypothetical protein RL077_1950, partial [Verrucomicrobiota bacterium]
LKAFPADMREEKLKFQISSSCARGNQKFYS